MDSLRQRAKELHQDALVCDTTLPWISAAYNDEPQTLPKYVAGGVDFISLTIATDWMSIEATVRHIAAERRRFLTQPGRYLFVETVADRYPGCGPLAGIHAATLASRFPHVFVAACDMPGLDADVIRFLVARIGAADAVVPCWNGDVEPLHAVYAAHCGPAIEACLRAGRHALRDFLAGARVDYVDEAELGAVGGAAASLTNVNTPEELAAVGGCFEEPRG